MFTITRREGVGYVQHSVVYDKTILDLETYVEASRAEGGDCTTTYEFTFKGKAKDTRVRFFTHGADKTEVAQYKYDSKAQAVLFLGYKYNAGSSAGGRGRRLGLGGCGCCCS